ncbi:MAG: hypothetical protein WBJ10_13815 [Daejeonella sp.]|uniref:glycoside hydrolase family 113 n=1 Tax=Daejeonella sp. TaxID=2805397 RepID=UPI003C769F57
MKLINSIRFQPRIQAYSLILVLVFLSSCSQTSNTSPVFPKIEKKINGLSFVASPRKVTDSVIAPVIDINANWVTLMPFGFMRDSDNPQIQYNNDRQWWGESKEGIKHTAMLFKERGIKVMLKPQLWVGRGNFTGHIKMDTEENWVLLENQYEIFILDFASHAQEIGFDMFCIGTELNTFVSNRPEYWVNLINKIRKVYKGKITYAENWDTYSKVPFWSKLDYIGVDAYFPLSSSKNITLKMLNEGWNKHKKSLRELSHREEKQILFTEYGYRSTNYTAREPWSSGGNSVNSENQKIALKALFDNFWMEPWFAGGFLWKWYDHINPSRESISTDYTPQNKPAEIVIKENYGKNY